MTATDSVVVDGVIICFTQEAYERESAKQIEEIENSPRRSAMIRDWEGDCE